jgi:hypothetical protein
LRVRLFAFIVVPFNVVVARRLRALPFAPLRCSIDWILPRCVSLFDVVTRCLYTITVVRYVVTLFAFVDWLLRVDCYVVVIVTLLLVTRRCSLLLILRTRVPDCSLIAAFSPRLVLLDVR